MDGFLGFLVSQKELPLLLVEAITAFWLRGAAQPGMQSGGAARLPPGPRAWPIIGHLRLLGELPHQSLSRLASIHGPLMSLRLGSAVAVVASSPEMAKHVLQTHDQAFASRPRTAAFVHILSDCSDIGSAPYGPYWKLMRQLCLTDLFHSKRIESFKPSRAAEVGSLMRSLLEDSRMRRPILVRRKLLAATNNIISRMVVGKKISELSSCSDMVSLMNEALHLLGVFNLGDYIPFLAWMDVQGYVRRMKAVKRRVKEAFGEIIDARRDARRANPCAPKDLLDVLLESHNQPVTDDNITAVLLNMFAAGTDTSSITIEWGLAEILANPTTMKKAQDELDLIVGKERLVQESDIPHLSYLQAVVKETMRLHPAAPLLVPHESIQPCHILSYFIPTKTLAYINVWAIGRDPDTWENPLKFIPERFLGRKVDVRGQHFEFLPFGSGRRGCPRWQLGLLNVQLMLASLLQGFDWQLPTSTHENGGKVDMTEKFGLTVMMAHPLAIIATPRLPIDLYKV